MKILFFSDIHGITTNLDYLKKLDEKEKFDKVVVLGDLYSMGFNKIVLDNYDNFAVKDFLMEFGNRLICIRGNCDSELDVKVSDFPIIDNISLISVDNINIYCTHGHYYSYSNRGKFDNNSVLIYGHEHIPYLKEDSGNLFICVGSISLPRENSVPSYVIYENKEFNIYNISGENIGGFIY